MTTQNYRHHARKHTSHCCLGRRPGGVQQNRWWRRKLQPKHYEKNSETIKIHAEFDVFLTISLGTVVWWKKKNLYICVCFCIFIYLFCASKKNKADMLSTDENGVSLIRSVSKLATSFSFTVVKKVLSRESKNLELQRKIPWQLSMNQSIDLFIFNSLSLL